MTVISTNELVDMILFVIKLLLWSHDDSSSSNTCLKDNKPIFPYVMHEENGISEIEELQASNPSLQFKASLGCLTCSWLVLPHCSLLTTLHYYQGHYSLLSQTKSLPNYSCSSFIFVTSLCHQHWLDYIKYSCGPYKFLCYKIFLPLSKLNIIKLCFL